MPTQEAVERAAAAGRTRAGEIVERSGQVRFAAVKPFQGRLVAGGDSWFDYPAFEDILESLESEHNFGEPRPILIHGYSAPVPDGRGYPLLGLSGPWLKPAFARHGHVTADPQADAEQQANRSRPRGATRCMRPSRATGDRRPDCSRDRRGGARIAVTRRKESR